ncbi:GRAM domain-containing protein [Oceanobacillus limi]|uniref:GRAM domain-containing protein n=1 Tax=Oceanobacillus limi TaxID=930131 RepID=A0A1I0DPX5_9BACI|nr:GRAM domain-containing protein [Oceanobacillus limi]SET34291.1 GRAM domain-containing protein [Oceanobacillus limi]
MVDLVENESIQLTAAANLKRGKEAVGGKITITNRRVYFKPHAINIQKEPLEFPLEQISNVEKSKSLGLIPNVLIVTLNNGNVHHFVVNKRQKIMDYIETAIQN